MRKLNIVDEFRTEASTSLLTKTQAMAITIRLLQLELADPTNSESDLRVLSDMLKRFDFHYLDETPSEIDTILDNANVARLCPEDVLKAIDLVRFDVE